MIINDNIYVFQNKKDGARIKIEIQNGVLSWSNNLTISGLTVQFKTVKYEVEDDTETLAFYSESGDLVAFINPVEWETLDHKEVKL